MKGIILFAILIVYIIVVSLFFKYDPTGHLKDYQALSIFSAILGFFVLAGTIMIARENIVLGIPTMSWNATKRFLKVFLGTLLGLGVLLGIIFLIMQFIGDPSPTLGSIMSILNIAIIVTTISLIIYFIKDLDYFKQNTSYFNLFKNMIFYIPCLFIDLVDAIKKEYKITTRTSLIILAIDIALILLHKHSKTILSILFNTGGITLLDSPAYLNNQKKLGSFKQLHSNNTENKFSYNYAISMWIYINPQPPNTNPSYSQFTTLFNYGNKPHILYKADTNQLKVMMNLNDNVEKELLVKKGLLLQKWNNIVINYDRGTMDIFLNKELVSSHGSVAPYMSYDNMVSGSHDGIHGGIKKVIYFNKSLNLRKIKNLYVML